MLLAIDWEHLEIECPKDPDVLGVGWGCTCTGAGCWTLGVTPKCKNKEKKLHSALMSGFLPWRKRRVFKRVGTSFKSFRLTGIKGGAFHFATRWEC